MVQVYGIPNCDTVKKTLAWLKENAVAFEFHDFKKEILTAEKLKEWVNQTGLEIMLNKRSIAFRNLSAVDKLKVAKKSEAIKLMQYNTNLIKRPVTEIAGTILHGFDAKVFQLAFSKK